MSKQNQGDDADIKDARNTDPSFKGLFGCNFLTRNQNVLRFEEDLGAGR